MTTERVFVLGGTGNIGTRLVRGLLSKKVAVTLYVRSPSKVETLFPENNGLINIIQGDLSDLSTLKEGIKGHTRLFSLATDFTCFVQVKTDVAKIAYEAGVKQIVDISSYTVNMGWRTSYIGSNHYHAEAAIYNLPNRGAFVALRPGRFMPNVIAASRVSPDDKIFDSFDDDHKLGFISTNDIGDVAAVILTEDIEKHGDAVYSLTGDVLTTKQRVEIVSEIIGREITYQQISPAQKYNMLMSTGHFSHLLAMDLVAGLNSMNESRITPELSILLGREPETLKEYLMAHKSEFIN